MANDLRRILSGSYVGTPLVCDHPANPKSGGPVRVGKLVGFALTNEQFGYQAGSYRTPIGDLPVNYPFDPVNNTDYQDGTTPVSVQLNEWDSRTHKVGGGDASVGDDVFYHDNPVDTDVHLVVNGTAGDRTGYAGILLSTIPTATTREARILLLPGGRGAALGATA